MDGSRRRKTLMLWLYLEVGDMPRLTPGGIWVVKGVLFGGF